MTTSDRSDLINDSVIYYRIHARRVTYYSVIEEPDEVVVIHLTSRKHVSMT